MANICLWLLISTATVSPSALLSTYVDFRVLETFLEIVVDCLIGDLADEGKVRNTDFLLLGAFEHRLFNLWLPSTTSTRRTFRLTVVLPPPCPFGDTLWPGDQFETVLCSTERHTIVGFGVLPVGTRCANFAWGIASCLIRRFDEALQLLL